MMCSFTAIPVVEPTKMVVPPSKSTTYSSSSLVPPTETPKPVGDNVLLVTLPGYNVETVTCTIKTFENLFMASIP